uniref:glutathione transferase n=1 Tax=Oryza meridionalis TaxID=40149 RepID=A0A0E0C213_9ORYZ
MAPVKVFGPAQSTNVARVLVCLEEVGAEYEVVNVDLKAKEHKSHEHLKRNDGDLYLFETRAIGKYILRKYKMSEVDLLREGNLKEAAMVDLWNEVETHQFNPALSSIVFQCIINPALHGISTNEKDVDETLKKVLEVYEAHLSENTYLAGDFVSFADLSHFYTFYFMATPYASLFDSYPHVKAWWERLVARPQETWCRNGSSYSEDVRKS